jgi:hypothetical protein
VFAGRVYTVPYPEQLAVFEDLSHTQYISPHRTDNQVAPIGVVHSTCTAVTSVCMYVHVSDVCTEVKTKVQDAGFGLVLHCFSPFGDAWIAEMIHVFVPVVSQLDTSCH